MEVSRWLKAQKQYSGYYLSLAIALGVLGGFLLIFQAWLLAKVIHAVVFETADLNTVLPFLWSMLVVFMVRAGLTWASEQTAFHAAVQVKLALREQLYAHIQKLGPAWLNNNRSGDLVNTLSDGIEALEAYYARFLPAMALVALVPLTILMFIFPVDWISALIMLATAPLIPFFMILIGKGAEARNQKQWRKLARMSAHFLDTIQGLTTLKLFNASQREAQMIAKISNEYRRSTMSVLRIAFLSSFALEFFATVSIALVAVIVGFRLFYGEMDFFYGFFVLLLAPEFYLPLRQMGTHYHARMEAIAAAERIVEIFNTPPPKNALLNTEDTLTQQANLFSTLPHIRFEHVDFSYSDGRQAIKQLNLDIKSGEIVALVGQSGAGKTTILNLLHGFLCPQAGVITINGVPLYSLSAEVWRKQLAWVPQKPSLFPGTVIENIRLGMRTAPLEAVKQATSYAQASEFIEALPQGYDTVIGEAGHGLSGGQIQRIALARAFLKNAPLLLLDEATANLDTENEVQIEQALQKLCQNRTVIMIAHRLRTIQNVDRIIVMNEGQIIETGTHESLSAKDSHYQRMRLAYGGYRQ